ncbi:unnamed protein product [Ectocarpus sp. 4 AP-2014]
MKHAHGKLLSQLWNMGRDEGCCTSEMKRCVASAQAIKNHAIHSRNQCSPYTAPAGGNARNWAYKRRATLGRTLPVIGTTASASDAATVGKEKAR